ncbi:prepilin-type N-terminal cleavage/methylation domain-containing protein [Lederbergia citrea]|uniref:Prepilin-type N-terminal cleavage/methylation domain-containing protein n=1 Tax=Lederbergia citrea TaxID=2833581 RepID=A0A942Z3J3_9BACI|nr:prepilin-type N-terminal cleavage/methylation domain-containing protein [Lederbergia citrea]MBS4204523.1 prepilin-type N-terminal cleavage/methylation domain-containing protein [Lederbergia citrea]MBS4223633.1 prepilin-type N-terminal cleavage/methylation domain-containing protein [Lederbergia citrea]
MEGRKMIDYLKNNRGVTLLEVLLVLAILSMVLVLISNVQILGQKQFVSQSQKIDHQANVRLAAKMITKEIRKAEAKNVTVKDNVLTIGPDNYKHSGTAIEKNGIPVIDHISEFKVNQQLLDQVSLIITSIQDRHGKKESISTTIYLRR